MLKNSEPNDDSYNKSLWAGQLPPRHQPHPHLPWFTSNPRFISIVISKQIQWCPRGCFVLPPRMASMSWEVHDVTRCSPWWITFKIALGTPVFRGALQRRQRPSRLWGLSSSSACAWVCFQDRTWLLSAHWVHTSIPKFRFTPGDDTWHNPIDGTRERIIRRPGLTSLHHLYSNCCKSTQGPLNLVKIKIIEREL